MIFSPKMFRSVLLLIAAGWNPCVSEAHTPHLHADICPDNGAANQTPCISPIFSGNELPFRITIELADFALPPNGLHSYASAELDGKWLFLAGRTNGMHDFSEVLPNFPSDKQNRDVYVIDPAQNRVYHRSLATPSSGLTQHQMDLLSVTSPQSYQDGDTLYMAGGYGVDSCTGQFSTKDVLTAINIRGLMHWVTHPLGCETAAQHIRQISNPIFQVTGGYMTKIGDNPTLLVFGQNFIGQYRDSSNGIYTEQVRRFEILDNGVDLDVVVKTSVPESGHPDYRRRDLNVVPVVKRKKHKIKESLVAFSGVFTLQTGVWTVPVEINAQGIPSQADPLCPKTFKQGMNNYVCPTVGLFSEKTKDMYNVFLGGISFGYYDVNNDFHTDPEFPFINNVTTIRIDKKGKYRQFIMDGTYPCIPASHYTCTPHSTPDPCCYFGAGGALLFPEGLPLYSNAVVKLDELGEGPVVIGYIVGGIQSLVQNTNYPCDSRASAYIFKVMLERL